MSTEAKSSHAQILKSSALVGSASAINVGIGIVRTKAMAVLLGTAGYGLFGLFWYISEIARIVAGMGINSSGVRQIAEAVGTGDEQKIGRTVFTLRRVSFILGLLGAVLLLALCIPISRLTFHDDKHAGSVALLSLVVFFGAISQGQLALIQGMRRIADLARNGVWGALLGVIFGVPIVYFFGERGVVPSLIGVAAMGILTSWWYSRRIPVVAVEMSGREVVREASGLLKLGFIFMSSALMSTGVEYLVRVILKRHIGTESGTDAGDAASGLYHAAWNLGSYYVAFILQAMGADFYPRLTAAAHDNRECNRLVNEQAEVSLLLAGPGMLATLTFAPVVIFLQYTADFAPAVEILRWICLGMMLRVVTWPMGFILVAKNARQLFLWSEILSNALHVGLVWWGVVQFGLRGAGMAFFGMYVLQWLGVYFMVRRLSGFRWTTENVRIGLIYGGIVALVFASQYFLPQPIVITLGVVATIATGIFSLRKLCTMLPVERFPRRARQLLGVLRILPANSNA